MKTTPIAQFLSILILSIWFAGCASTVMSHAERVEAYNNFIVSEKLEPLKRITAFKFDSWSSLGQEHLIIRATHNRPYLITLKNRCHDLHHAMEVGVDNTGSMLYAGFDAIVVPDNHGQKCYIKNIYKLTKEQKKAILDIASAPEETTK